MKSFLPVIFLLIIVSMSNCKHDIPLGADPGTPITPGSSGTPGTPGSPGSPQVVCSPDTTYFRQEILPIFVSNCTFSSCHDAASHQHGLVLTSYTGIMEKITAYNLNNSDIWKKINETDPAERMPQPPRNPLTTAQKNAIRQWILQGAKNNSCQASTCDTATVTFNIQVKSIIANKCQGCHSSTSPANGYDFSTYAGVKARVTDGKLWGAINHIAGFSAMPKNGSKLSDCEIATFRKWIDAGSPNN
jgi:cytochrome c5